jgi:hypothetical protein
MFAPMDVALGIPPNWRKKMNEHALGWRTPDPGVSLEKLKTPSELRHREKVLARRKKANKVARKARRVNRLRAR